MSKGVFITGTGTDVGKTYVTALILKALREQGINAGYFKAALSGAEYVDGNLVPGDAEYVFKIADIPANANELVPYIYKTAASPHLAAQIENNPIEIEKIRNVFQKTSNIYDYVVAEGSGGIVCPLRLDHKTIMLTDVIRLLDFGIVIVANSGLGSINSTLLTVEYARNRNIEIMGIILNMFEAGNIIHEDNKKTIETLTGLPILACVPMGARKIGLEEFAFI
jgi:dethiobiotin synthetase